MEIFLLVIHVLVCFVLILSILMQPGKSGGLSGGAFGGMSGGSSMFGGGGAVPLLAKVTTYTGVIFALTCIGLWYASRPGESGAMSAAERALQQQGAMQMQSLPQPLAPATQPGAEQTTPAGQSGTEQTTPAETGQ